MTFLKGHWQLLALTALIAALWQTPVVAPLKILIVFLHELGHVIATVLTGGEVLSLTIDPQQGGLVTSRGGSRFIALSAGYLGSLLIGVALFVFAIRTKADKAVVGLLGLTLLWATAAYIRDWFALGFGLASAALLLTSAWFLRREINDLILRVIGLASMIYVPLDIFSDTIARSHLRSDARMLAEEFAGPTLLWGGLWLFISVGVIALTLRIGLEEDSNISFQ
ncbi:M50 family metallopeptidase [Roseovarius sp. 2305UL8-3]|uniref:M50 family metallopeptidase n=1 Tax=Roseovarius conchicola TaxID=3121636 RepID=UPI0035274EEF